MRNEYCIANWKMNQSNIDCENFSNYIKSNINNNSSKMIICPANIHLSKMVGLFEDFGVSIGSQNVSDKSNGAFTGEISCEMLLDNKINWTILGHSERRQFYHETNLIVHDKLENTVNNRINPILCIGETLKDREAGNTIPVLKNQIEIAFKDLDFTKVEIVIAYEPVWAIGTGVAADFETIAETHQQIRTFLQGYISNANEISILYGGSVNPENCRDILNIKDVDGFLIGGASLDPQKFLNIYTQMNEIGVESL
jgi:triosephosphate isomerase (TIM)